MSPVGSCLHGVMTEHHVDPAISEAVQGVANRFGVAGLEELLRLATEQLEQARQAYAELGRDPD